MKALTKNLSILLFIFSVLAVLNACKKNKDKETAQENQQHSMQAALEAMKARYKNEPASYTQVLNLKGKGFWADEKGNQITRHSSPAGRIAACPDPGEDYPTQSVYSVKREYTCGQGFRIEVKYDVKLAYTPLKENASLVPSFGRVLLFNSTGTRVWPTTTPLPKHSVLTVENLGSAGTDPNGLALTNYRITFRSDYIPDGIFNASTSMQTYLSVYTDCVDYPTFVCPFSTQQSDVTSQQNFYPCTRIDPVYWNPGIGIGASVAGVNTIPSDCLPYGYVFPEQQEIQVYCYNQWQPMRLWRYGTTTFKEYRNTGIIDNFDIWYVTVDGYTGGGTSYLNGNYPVRYRNKMITTNAGGPCVTEPVNTWVTTTWDLSLY